MSNLFIILYYGGRGVKSMKYFKGARDKKVWESLIVSDYRVDDRGSFPDRCKGFFQF
jgi:hypothetical protein